MNAPDRYERFVVPEGVKKYGIICAIFFNFFLIFYFNKSEQQIWLGFRMRGTQRSWMQLHLLLKERIIQSGTLFACSSSFLFIFIEFSVIFATDEYPFVKNWFFFWILWIWLTGNYIGMIMFCLLGTSCLILFSTKSCSGLVSRVLCLCPYFLMFLFCSCKCAVWLSGQWISGGRRNLNTPALSMHM